MIKYRPGTLVEYDSYFSSLNELLLIIEAVGTTLGDGPLYDVYNITHGLFMERSQSFLDKYYKILVE